MIDNKHLKVALQALAYLIAVKSVTGKKSAFDVERERALVAIREHLEKEDAL